MRYPMLKKLLWASTGDEPLSNISTLWLLPYYQEIFSIFCWNLYYSFSRKNSFYCNKRKMSDEIETKVSNAFSRNSKVTELLELCIQPETRKDLERVLLNFWDTFDECVLKSEDFGEFDVVTMFALNYIYGRSSVPLSAVSRSVYAYYKQVVFTCEKFDRSLVINCGNDCVVKTLRQITDLDYLKRETILPDIVLYTVMRGNLGLALFLVKFGLVEFPTDIDKGSRIMTEYLLCWFSRLNKSRDAGSTPACLKDPAQVEDLLNKLQQNKKISFRRSMIIFCMTCIIFEITECEEPIFMQFLSNYKLRCLEWFIETIAEPYIKLNDVEYFVTTFLNGHLNDEIWKSFQKVKEFFPDAFNSRNIIRTLKDLTRCKIRECLVSSARTLPEQVSKLPVLDNLKEFLLFPDIKLWDSLVYHQKDMYLSEKIRLLKIKIREMSSRI